MGEEKARTLVKEQDHHEQAFELYYGMGVKRSFQKVANRLGVSLSAVKLWARSFSWRDRLAEREVHVAREMAARALNDEVSRRERSLQIVQLALVQLAKAIAEGRVKMTLSDLDKLIRLEAFLSDEPESRHSLIVADLRGKTIEELRAMMRKEVDALREIEASETEIAQWESEGRLLAAPAAVPKDSTESSGGNGE